MTGADFQVDPRSIELLPGTNLLAHIASARHKTARPRVATVGLNQALYACSASCFAFRGRSTAVAIVGAFDARIRNTERRASVAMIVVRALDARVRRTVRFGGTAVRIGAAGAGFAGIAAADFTAPAVRIGATIVYRVAVVVAADLSGIAVVGGAAVSCRALIVAAHLAGAAIGVYATRAPVRIKFVRAHVDDRRGTASRDRRIRVIDLACLLIQIEGSDDGRIVTRVDAG